MDDATNRVWYADFYVLRAGDNVGCLAIDGLAIDAILVDRTRHTNASIAAWFKRIVKNIQLHGQHLRIRDNYHGKL